MRLNKFLSYNVAGSRREAERLIAASLVKVNSVVITDPACDIKENDCVELNNKKVEIKNSFEVIAFNKPRFCVTSKTDPQGRKTIYDFLPEKFANFRYAGRLDYDSKGLLIMTNTTAIAEHITSPSSKVEKVYKIKLSKPLEENLKNEIENGIVLDDGYKTKPSKLEYASSNKKDIIVTITEGKKRQVRRMFQAVKNKVIDLERIKVGGIELKDLKQGCFRYLSESEISLLKK